jgi:NAD-dependent deacetylase
MDNSTKNAPEKLSLLRKAQQAQRVVFMGTSFSVNITSIALRTALSNEAAIEVVDPQPIDLGYERIEYHRMMAADYVSDRLG